MEKEFGAFIIGLFIGVLMAVLILAYNLKSSEQTITTNKKIIPEWRLVTDGKVVDTLYIYKQK